jgi:hypothetical protein
MKYLISLKATIRFILIYIITTLLFASCQKTLSIDETPAPPIITTTPPDLTTKVTSTLVSGFVTDGNDAAVKDASVLIGTVTVLTDKYGYFEARNVQMVQNAAVVTVSKVGFFKGIKTYIAESNKAAFFRIKLIPKLSVGEVNGSAGGVVTLPGGLSINFPASAVVNASTNSAYTGIITVAAFYINPTATDLNSVMPGDLRGLNTEGELKLLTTYGMAAVELTGASGELLQIASGKKATITMPIPTSILATAPATIPLWYFDEIVGLWKQEGAATKIGSTYVGDVSHFSFWNYDVPANYVRFNCTVVNSAGLPIPNVQVKISLISNPINAAYGYTDSSGYVSGAVPNNAQLLLEVLSNVNCANVILSQNFTTTNVNVNYGNVVINSATYIATINGIITNCSGAPVTNGYIIMRKGTVNSKYALSATGTYSISQLFCSGNDAINYTIYAEDLVATQQGNPVVYPIVVGVNNIPTIQACGTSIARYINTTVNGLATNFVFPTDNVTVRPDSTANNYISVFGFKKTVNLPLYANFNFAKVGIGVGSTQNLINFSSESISPNSTITSPINVNISEYGNIGQFVAGNFAGIIIGPPPSSTIYNITCNFRYQREF